MAEYTQEEQRLIRETTGDLLPPVHTLKFQHQRFMSGDLKHLTWAQFEKKLCTWAQVWADHG